METNGSNSHSHQNGQSGDSKNSHSENPPDRTVFVNPAEIAWHEARKEWVGDPSRRSQRTPREPIMSWNSTYEDLLCSSEPFQQPIPLTEMVDFLVDIWHEEGLYD